MEEPKENDRIGSTLMLSKPESSYWRMKKTTHFFKQRWRNILFTAVGTFSTVLFFAFLANLLFDNYDQNYVNDHLYKKNEFDSVDEIKELHLPVNYLIRNKRSFETDAKNRIDRELKNLKKEISCRAIEKDCQTIFNSMEGLAKKIHRTVEDAEGLLREINLLKEIKKDPTMMQISECIKCRDVKRKVEKLSDNKSEIKNSINIRGTKIKKLGGTSKKFETINLAENLTVDEPKKFHLPIVQKIKRNDKAASNQQPNPTKLPGPGNSQPLVMKQANMYPSYQSINSNQPNPPQHLNNQPDPSTSPPIDKLPQRLCLPFSQYSTIVYVLPSNQLYPQFTNVPASVIPTRNIFGPADRPVPAFPPTGPGRYSYSSGAVRGYPNSYPPSAAGGYSNSYPPSAAGGYLNSHLPSAAGEYPPLSQSYKTDAGNAAPLYYPCTDVLPAYFIDPSVIAAGSGYARNWRFEQYEGRSRSSEPSQIYGKSASNPDQENECKIGSHRCRHHPICIPHEEFCNGFVNCPDASDEANCLCEEIIPKHKLCDGYNDCPLGEDERNCSDCPKDYFDCQDPTVSESNKNCINGSLRCNGKKDCKNGKDEDGCTILTEHFDDKLTNVGFTEGEGYLFKNFEGQWYPACEATVEWVNEVCHLKTGELMKETPIITKNDLPEGTFIVNYLAQNKSDHYYLTSLCKGAVHVKCPTTPFGTLESKYSRNSLVQTKHRESEGSLSTSVNHTNATGALGNDRNTILGVIGGRASKPKAWPFIAIIYRDGIFLCGGSIINDQYIMTSAHCVDKYDFHYYEIFAGLLRQKSFSPTTQVRSAIEIISYPDYNRTLFEGDIALIKLNKPFKFNEWIKPVGLPEKNWMNEPKLDASCIVIGWGRVSENDFNSDHLQEAEILIQKCEDNKGSSAICAGVPDGGIDSCNGDSGGPLICETQTSESQSYIAGIVSHGKGCAKANGYGVYFKVASAITWIEKIIGNESVFQNRSSPKTICPGFKCPGKQGKCLADFQRCDKTIDCLGSEDEIDCIRSTTPSKIDTNSYNRKSDIIEDKSCNASIISTSEKNSTSIVESNEYLNNHSKSAISRDFENSTNFHSRNSLSDSILDTDERSPNSEESTDERSPGSTKINTNEVTATSSYENMTSERKIILPDEIKRFTCKKLIQTISIEFKCDGIFDCDDGTDEDNCLCKDNLYDKSLICNGYIDCYDGSDEEGCSFCNENEFFCSRSGKCIPLEKRCDSIADCPLEEDELHCYALTNGEYINIDINGLPHLATEGIITSFKNGSWVAACYDQNISSTFIGDNVCMHLGLKGQEHVEQTTVKTLKLDENHWTSENASNYQYSREKINELSTGNELESCQGLRIKCKLVLSSSVETHEIQFQQNNESTYSFPWDALIFVDGLYQCAGTLLQNDWVLTTFQCTKNINLNQSIITVVLGVSQTFLYVDGPHQQIRRIDAIKLEEKLDISMLHLEQPINFTRHVQPIFVKKITFPAADNDTCIATRIGQNLTKTSVFLKTVTEGCANCHRCYKNATIQNCNDNKTEIESGTIVCRGDDGWYPAAVFYEKDLMCGFTSIQTLTSIDYLKSHLMETMEETVNSTVTPICDGVRCAIGDCIPWENVCDGINDCREALDENQQYCKDKKELCEALGGTDCKCSKSELRCGDGTCIPKEFFCDEKLDCPDGTDEPKQCNCASYLALTSPEKICDNKQDCYDRTDETSDACLCTEESFLCSSNTSDIQSFGRCIPQDLVCDGYMDCPNNADERHCRDIRGRPNDPQNIGEVYNCVNGIWQPKCFTAPLTTKQNATDICKSFNYDDGVLLNDEIAAKYNDNTIMIRRLNDFHVVVINRYTLVTMRDEQLITTNITTPENCHRAFVECFKL